MWTDGSLSQPWYCVLSLVRLQWVLQFFMPSRPLSCFLPWYYNYCTSNGRSSSSSALPTRENWCMGTKNFVTHRRRTSWRICCGGGSPDYLYLIEWLGSYFVAHRRPIKREGRQPLETLEVSWFYNKNWTCFTTKNILQEDEIYSTAKLKLAGKLSTPSLLLDNCMNLLK